MRTLKSASGVFFLFVLLLTRVAPLSAAPMFSCQSHSCYPPWGTYVGPDYCVFLEQTSCINALETCQQFCDSKGGVWDFSCDSQGDGSCGCTNIMWCVPCTVDPESCDPQTPFNPDTCSCQASPLIVDLDGDGILLTALEDGVLFDMTGTGAPRQTSWTRGGSRDGLLVLDRNGDGAITTGAELFGSLTEQPSVESPNGFLALQVFDEPANGGNGDGAISRKDQVFESLRLWIDANHNGSSESVELISLLDAGVSRIALDYETDDRIDEFGNTFRLRARIWDNVAHTKFVWDVFLNVAPIR